MKNERRTRGSNLRLVPSRVDVEPLGIPNVFVFFAFSGIKEINQFYGAYFCTLVLCHAIEIRDKPTTTPWFLNKYRVYRPLPSNDAKMEWRPMYPRRICPAHSRHLAEKVRPPKKRGKKAGRAGWQDNVVRPSTAGEMSGTSQAFLPQANSMGRGQGR